MTPNIWKYGERQKAGAMLVNWISDPRARDCKVSRSKLTAQDLESRGYTIRYTSKSLNSKYVEPLSQVGLPTEGEFYHHIDIEAPFATVRLYMKSDLLSQVCTMRTLMVTPISITSIPVCGLGIMIQMSIRHCLGRKLVKFQHLSSWGRSPGAQGEFLELLLGSTTAFFTCDLILSLCAKFSQVIYFSVKGVHSA